MNLKENCSEMIKYYDINGEKFSADTRDLEFKEIQSRFLRYLKPGSRILDLGCGSGRDTKYFLQKGFLVEAIDGSAQMCKIASDYTGICVERKLFQDIDDRDKYDGIWACASLVHLPYNVLIQTFDSVGTAMREKSVFYASFKYGEFEGWRKERYFTDMTEEKMAEVLRQTQLFELKEMWITSDARAGREEEKWLNIILVKSFPNQR